MSRFSRIPLAIVPVLMLSACTSIERHPVPIEAMDRAIIPGMPGIRDWGDEPSPEFQRDLVESVQQARGADGSDSLDRPTHALVLSGGGSNGAFGAGFLSGWTQAATRPTFKLVTGISTGALIAPYAFLGPDFDDELERAFTTVTNKDVFKIRSPFTVLRKDSLTRTDPLADRIEEVIDDEMLRAIAAEHRVGRRLYVGTTNLDAQRIMIWNMGAIATSGHPDALDLFRKVLLASASIPVAGGDGRHRRREEQAPGRPAAATTGLGLRDPQQPGRRRAGARRAQPDRHRLTLDGDPAQGGGDGRSRAGPRAGRRGRRGLQLHRHPFRARRDTGRQLAAFRRPTCAGSSSSAAPWRWNPNPGAKSRPPGRVRLSRFLSC
jgi:hypothetical protein